MASYCTKCGTPLDAGARFCTRCGTAVAEAGVPATSQAAQPAVGAPAAPPKGSNALKVVVIVLAVFVGLGILASAAVMFGLWQFSRAVRVDPASEKVSIQTPMGSMTMGKTEVTEADLGIPIYPGATSQEGSLRIDSSQGSMDSYVFRTSDSPQQVIDFYREKLGSSADFVVSSEGGIITSSPSQKEGYMLTVGRDESQGGTIISIVRGLSSGSQ